MVAFVAMQRNLTLDASGEKPAALWSRFRTERFALALKDQSHVAS
jgi:hypothetical protein